MHSLASPDPTPPDNWDDLRFVLAVVDQGTISGAARQLGVNHATVLRRIAAFETWHGSPLFERSHSGYRVPADRLRTVEGLREVQRAVLAVNRLMQGHHAPLSGAVRLTSTDSICQLILPPIIAAIRREAPELRFDLYATNAHLELARLQADITVRPAVALPDDLFGVVAADIGFAAYVARGAGGVSGWLGIGGPSARSLPAQWMDANIAKAEITGAADSFLILREMAAGGQGHTILPCYLGDRDPRLVRLAGLIPPMRVSLWVASHIDLADTPRVRAVRGMLAAGLRAEEAWLSGDAG